MGTEYGEGQTVAGIWSRWSHAYLFAEAAEPGRTIIGRSYGRASRMSGLGGPADVPTTRVATRQGKSTSAPRAAKTSSSETRVSLIGKLGTGSELRLCEGECRKRPSRATTASSIPTWTTGGWLADELVRELEGPPDSK